MSQQVINPGITDPLRSHATRGVFWTSIATFGTQLASLVVFAVLAQLLEPRAFGLVGMAMVFVSFGSLFAEQGMGQAIVQREELEPEHLDAAFWTNAAIGFLLSALGMLLAPIVAALYRESELVPVASLLSLTLMITALGSTQQSLLQRDFQFRALTIRRLAASLLGGVAGVVAALLGLGVYALVVKALVEGVVGLFLLWTLSTWRPTLHYSWPHARELLVFGLNMTGVKFTIFVRGRLDDFLIGLFLGPEALGYYVVAYRLGRLTLDVFGSITGGVILPIVSRVQHDSARCARALNELFWLTSVVDVPRHHRSARACSAVYRRSVLETSGVQAYRRCVFCR